MFELAHYFINYTYTTLVELVLKKTGRRNKQGKSWKIHAEMY